jgi:outer membrane protein assembly factor BamE (lipoprotein component of BamABCDE complex)
MGLLIVSGLGFVPRPFDRSVWLDPSLLDEVEGWNHSVRQQMVDDLLASSLKRGMSKSEVEQLIGPPDPHPLSHTGDWNYRLGADRNMLSADSEWLVIDFDKEGRVSRAERYID